MSHCDKAFEDAELAFSDDEKTPFQQKPKTSQPRKSTKLTVFGVISGYLIIGMLYAKLWVHSARLETQLQELKPELFPCQCSLSRVWSSNSPFG